MSVAEEMRAAELAAELGDRGVWLRCSPSEGTLHYSPASRVTPELKERIGYYKERLIRMMVEDEELKTSGKLQSERQVFEEFRELTRSRGKEGAA